MKDIMVNVVPHVGSHWVLLGLNLGVSTEQLRAIQWNNHGDCECSREMLQWWIVQDSSPTWHKLLEALKNSDCTLPTMSSTASTAESYTTKSSETCPVHSNGMCTY